MIHRCKSIQNSDALRGASGVAAPAVWKAWNWWEWKTDVLHTTETHKIWALVAGYYYANVLLPGEAKRQLEVCCSNRLHPVIHVGVFYPFTSPRGIEGWVGWPKQTVYPQSGHLSTIDQAQGWERPLAKDRRPNHWEMPPSVTNLIWSIHLPTWRLLRLSICLETYIDYGTYNFAFTLV